ncbi:hypothetical protein AR687_08775 [Flavobacteriaceae bacterium CRH]|nr:hypothetical protein AR687_08775 [Flavobacteriaceae bacterium CRH]
MAQTKTVVTQFGEKVTISPYANNGLSTNNGFIQLGGALTQQSVLTTTASFTLAIKGLQTGTDSDNILVTDANGVLKYVSRSGFGGADNLGNHIATMDLNMSNKNITNIFNAYIKNEAQIADRATSNTNYFGIYKNNGLFGIWNNIKSTNALTIDETTNKTTLTSAQIAKGTDGGLPQPNYLAVSADGAGNILWKNPATVPGLISGTEWYLANTTTDATDNKTGSIYRTGKVAIGVNTNPTTTLDINSGGTTTAVSPALKIVDGTQGANKVLTSDANGVTRWEAAGITLATGVLGGGVNIPSTTTGITNYLSTGSSVTLPPGKWLVTVNMIITKVGNSVTGNSESWWVRSTFSDGGTSGPSRDIQGSNNLISGALSSSCNYGLVSGSVVISNTGSGNKTYNYIAGYLDGSGRTGNLAWFGGTVYGEDSIIFQSVH